MEFELSGAKLSDDAVQTLGLHKNRAFMKLREHVLVDLALQGQHDLALSSIEGSLNVAGRLNASMAIAVAAGRYAQLLQRFAPEGRELAEGDKFELVRKQLPFDVDWTLDLATNAPVAPSEFALIARPVFRASEAKNWLDQLIREFLAEQSRKRPLQIAVGQKLAHELAALEGMDIEQADLVFTPTALEIRLSARQHD